MFSVKKYGKRNYAVFDGDTLLCVCLYKKGALNVKGRLEEQAMYIAGLESKLEETKKPCQRSLFEATA